MQQSHTAIPPLAPTTALGLTQSMPMPAAMMDGFESFSANAESNSSRRQRISMACQYCRHRKIRCCGGAPCRNCTRSSRECDYTPVPEEVNRATREKKAVAKASKPVLAPTPSPSLLQTATMVPSPMTSYSPCFLHVPAVPTPGSEAGSTSAGRPVHLGHRRSSSTPNYASASWRQPPPAPMLNSPAQLESSAWMYNNWSSAPPVPMPLQVPSIETTSYTPPTAFPSVFEQAPMPMHAPAHYLVPSQHQAHMVMSTPMPSASTMPAAPSVPVQRMPMTPSHSRANSMGPLTADYNSPYQISNPYVPSTPSTYLAPPASTPGAHTAYKGLSVQTQAAPLALNYDYATPPVSPGPNAYYTPYATPSLYSSSSAQTAMYTPSPPAMAASPTLAMEMPVVKEELVGLGLGMGMGSYAGYGGYTADASLGVQVVEHDVFYTPNMGSDAYFPTVY